jgi:hypothetical protein
MLFNIFSARYPANYNMRAGGALYSDATIVAGVLKWRIDFLVAIKVLELGPWGVARRAGGAGGGRWGRRWRRVRVG